MCVHIFIQSFNIYFPESLSKCVRYYSWQLEYKIEHKFLTPRDLCSSVQRHTVEINR